MTPQGRVLDLNAYRAARAGVEEAWVRNREVAEHFGGVSIRTVRRWTAAGMPHRRLGRQLVLYRLSECQAWHDEQNGAA